MANSSPTDGEPAPMKEPEQTPLTPSLSPHPGKGVRRLRKRRRADLIARWVVSIAGVAIIALILGILVFIVGEVLPLMKPAEVKARAPERVSATNLGPAICDDYANELVILLGSGRLALQPATGGTLAALYDVFTGERVDDAAGQPLEEMSPSPNGRSFTARSQSGDLLLIPAQFETTFGVERSVAFKPRPATVFKAADVGPVHAFSIRRVGSSGAAAAVLRKDGQLLKFTRTIEIDDFTEEVTEETETKLLGTLRGVRQIHLSQDLARLYLLGDDGSVGYLDLAVPDAPVQWRQRASKANVLQFIKGESSLITGHEDGELVQWQVLNTEAGRRFDPMRSFDGKGAPVIRLAASHRHKGFLALDSTGHMGLYHPTSERLLWDGNPGLKDIHSMALAPRDDAAVLLSKDSLMLLDVQNHHPEAGLKAYFGKIWYEDYPAPAHVWQSSAGNDEYEPKLGLMPLIVGTLKGTLFSLIFAVPIAVLAALYASQFMHPTLRGRVKPAIEIMAAVPSVVLGFVAGLWLAQLLHKVLPGLILIPVLLPLSIILGGWLWHLTPKTFRKRFRAGTEVAFIGLFALLGVGLCVLLSPVMESLVFGGDFPTWLREWMGLAYDQQNAIVVSIAMGFAVIPIIFTIAEEAFSAVPRNLPLGSLALGATPWQTVVRVVVPSASPGVFSAIMVGFGRAVGETMIDLMAAGNTPILDWNPFLGFRTLSANIATEIPEAPVGGTLYRTLFLAALLLFILTFAVNTIAEVVRGRLRKRYANL